MAWKIAQSPRLGQLFVAPGNAGTEALAINVPLDVTDGPGVVAFARDNRIDLVVVAPDDALAAGLVDQLTAAGIAAFGPSQAAAQLESSKAFSKDLMMTTGVPTARFQTFTDREAAGRYVAGRTFPQVIKASGLALGKGVTICHTLTEAQRVLDEFMTAGQLGTAGQTVVIEDFLTGQEVSLHAFCDGRTAVLFPPAQDHKAIGDGGVGPNTGGMGTYCPVPFVAPEQLTQLGAAAVDPILTGLAARNRAFRGVLYPGLMVGPDRVNVLEYNARFGDPETQSYLRLLQTDLVDIMWACINGRLAEQPVRWLDQSAVTVVMASAGYPGAVTKGYPISGLAAAAQIEGVQIFHAGTRRTGGQVVTAGGRVLGVSAVAPTLVEARDRAYQAVRLIQFYGAQYRTDIAAAAIGSAN